MRPSGLIIMSRPGLLPGLVLVIAGFGAPDQRRQRLAVRRGAHHEPAAGDPVQVAATVLYGRGGMPAFKDSLPDPVLADIVSYVRASWGNKAKPIGPEVFAKVRTGPPPAAKLQAH